MTFAIIDIAVVMGITILLLSYYHCRGCHYRDQHYRYVYYFSFQPHCHQPSPFGPLVRSLLGPVLPDSLRLPILAPAVPPVPAAALGLAAPSLPKVVVPILPFCCWPAAAHLAALLRPHCGTVSNRHFCCLHMPPPPVGA